MKGGGKRYVGFHNIHECAEVNRCWRMIDTSTSFHYFDVVFLELSYSYLLIIDAEMAKNCCDLQHYESLNRDVGAYLVAAGSNGMSKHLRKRTYLPPFPNSSLEEFLFQDRVKGDDMRDNDDKWLTSMLGKNRL